MRKSLSRIKKYVQACQACQRGKPRNEKDPGHLHNLEIPGNRWTDISVDFIGPLPKSDSKDAVMVVVDRLTKRAHFIATTTKASAQEIGKLFEDYIFKLHGLPKSIMSDRDTRFTSKYWKCFIESLGLTANMSTAFHQRSNGLAERTIRSLKQYLSIYCNATSTDWMSYLSLAEFSYNSVYNSSLRMSPFVADLGYLPSAPVDLTLPSMDSGEEPGVQFLENQTLVRLLCVDALLDAQQRNRRAFNANRRTQEF